MSTHTFSTARIALAVGGSAATIALALSAPSALADPVIPADAPEAARISLDLSRATAVGSRFDSDPILIPLEATPNGFSARLSDFSFDSDSAGERKTDRFNMRAAVPFDSPSGKYPAYIRAQAYFTVNKSNRSDVSAALKVGAFALGEIAQLNWPFGTELSGRTQELAQTIDLTNRASELRARFCNGMAPAGILTVDFVLSAARENAAASYLVLPLSNSVPRRALEVIFTSGELRACGG